MYPTQYTVPICRCTYDISLYSMLCGFAPRVHALWLKREEFSNTCCFHCTISAVNDFDVSTSSRNAPARLSSFCTAFPSFIQFYHSLYLVTCGDPGSFLFPFAHSYWGISFFLHPTSFVSSLNHSNTLVVYSRQDETSLICYLGNGGWPRCLSPCSYRPHDFVCQ